MGFAARAWAVLPRLGRLPWEPSSRLVRMAVPVGASRGIPLVAAAAVGLARDRIRPIPVEASCIRRPMLLNIPSADARIVGDRPPWLNATF
jgi:hypothetical protein